MANGRVYVGSNDFKVYALNAETGALVWSFATNGGVFSSPVVVDNVVYVGSTDNNHVCFRRCNRSYELAFHDNWGNSQIQPP